MRKFYPKERGGFHTRPLHADEPCGFKGEIPDLQPVHYCTGCKRRIIAALSEEYRRRKRERA